MTPEHSAIFLRAELPKHLEKVFVIISSFIFFSRVKLFILKNKHPLLNFSHSIDACEEMMNQDIKNLSCYL